MTLRTRFTLFTIFWFIFILIFYNIFVYFFVIRVTTRSELQLLTSKVELVRDSLRENRVDVRDPALLRELYAANEIIRVVDENGNVLNQVGYDQELLSLPPFGKRSVYSETTMLNGHRVILRSTPIYEEGMYAGAVEAARRLAVLDSYLQILVVVLSVTTAGAIVFAIFGTYWFTSRLTGPISQMVQTMREIDRSGKLRQVELSGREESVELRQLIRAFNQMIDRLDRTFERQKQFVADASHELKTPLTVIGSYADMLKRWGKDDEKIRDEAIEAVSRETERLRKLIQSMLMLAESEEEGWLHPSRFDLTALVQEMGQTLGKAFGREIRVRGPDHVWVYGDRDKIGQMLIILLDNAIKYSQQPIDIRIRSDKNGVQLEVTDYGIGIPESEIPFLFERFYRVDTARHRSTGGSGLGLSIAKRIIDLHEGTVEVFSKPGKGTTVAIHFPRKLLRFHAADAPTDRENNRKPGSGPGGQKLPESKNPAPSDGAEPKSAVTEPGGPSYNGSSTRTNSDSNM
jgi:signal transduction histidine kinase